MMDWQGRIEVNPSVLVGKPVVKGTRLAVEFIVGLLAEGWTIDEILQQYPSISEPDIRACLGYATTMLRNEQVFPLQAS
jgi:uncharacterized protein (DUF433 family)